MAQIGYGVDEIICYIKTLDSSFPISVGTLSFSIAYIDFTQMTKMKVLWYCQGNVKEKFEPLDSMWGDTNPSVQGPNREFFCTGIVGMRFLSKIRWSGCIDFGISNHRKKTYKIGLGYIQRFDKASPCACLQIRIEKNLSFSKCSADSDIPNPKHYKINDTHHGKWYAILNTRHNSLFLLNKPEPKAFLEHKRTKTGSCPRIIEPVHLRKIVWSIPSLDWRTPSKGDSCTAKALNRKTRTEKWTVRTSSKNSMRHGNGAMPSKIDWSAQCTKPVWECVQKSQSVSLKIVDESIWRSMTNILSF